VDHHTEPRQRLFDGLLKPPAVRIIAADRLALVAAGRNMIDGVAAGRNMLDGAGIFHSNGWGVP